jgi:hypothetical protein
VKRSSFFEPLMEFLKCETACEEELRMKLRVDGGICLWCQRIIDSRNGVAPKSNPLADEMSPDGPAENVICTLEGFHCALGAAEINQIDGVLAAYMEIAVDAEVPVAVPDFNGASTAVQRQTNRWNYSTLLFGSHRPDPEARLLLIEELFKVIRNSAQQLSGRVRPLVVWRKRPQFEVNTDEGVTYLRCRLCMPGVNLPSFGDFMPGGRSVFWVEGV